MFSMFFGGKGSKISNVKLIPLSLGPIARISINFQPFAEALQSAIESQTSIA